MKSSITIMCFLLFGISAPAYSKDSDNDGLSDAFEESIGSEAYLSDTDGDNIKDAEEVGSDLKAPRDSDNDGVIDILDYDDDNDGLPSFLESYNDTDNDGLLDYLDTDSDNDSILDGAETSASNQDKNLDGIDDAFDISREGYIDVNGDGIDDNIKLPDYNNDGVPDHLDASFPNSDNKISSEKIAEKDNAKLKTEAELEANGVEKVSIESTVKTAEKEDLAKKEKIEEKTKQAKPNVTVNKHTDTDNDGLPNDLERILKTNPLKRDSDGDNVSDAIEVGLDVNAPQDTDNDGTIDALDDDDDGDGLLTKLEDLNKDSTAINDDTDADGIPNYLDGNDDGDSLLTKNESLVWDSDNDGVIDYLDKSDGSIDVVNNPPNPIKTINEDENITVASNNEIQTGSKSIVLYDATKDTEDLDGGFEMKLVDEEPTPPEVSMLNPIVSNIDHKGRGFSEGKSIDESDKVINDDSISEIVPRLADAMVSEESSEPIDEVILEKESSTVRKSSKTNSKSHWDLF